MAKKAVKKLKVVAMGGAATPAPPLGPTKKGSGKNKVSKVGSITKQQAREIAEIKLPDLNAHDVEAGAKIIEGSARSMGIEVK